MKYNIYCDESRHLLNDKKDEYMVIGAIRCQTEIHNEIILSLEKIKKDNNFYPEIKWKRVSKNNINFYIKLIDFFFQNRFLDFRCIVINKNKVKLLDHNLTEDDFFYRMYFNLLKPKLRRKFSEYNILIDKKDDFTEGRCLELQEILENEVYSYKNFIQIEISCIDSSSSLLLQLCDFFIGAVGYSYNDYISNEPKLKACFWTSSRLGIESLDKQIKKFDKKFDIFEIALL